MTDSIENEEEKNCNSIKNFESIPIENQQNFNNENNQYNYDQYYEQNNNYINNTIKEVEQPQILNGNDTESNQNINQNIENENSNMIIPEEEIQLNIELEKSKRDIQNEINSNKLNQISMMQNDEYEINTKMDNIKINEYLEELSIKSNKEYTENENDIRSCRLSERNNNNKYLLIKEEEEQKNQNVIEPYNPDDIKEKDKDEFPFRIIGDARKKSKHISKYNSRYLELDAVKGLFKRYRSSKEYPKSPKKIIDIRDFKLIKKLKKVKEFHDLEITYYKTNKKGQKEDKIEYYRFRHQECRNKWFDDLLLIWKYAIKGNPVPKFSHNILLFIDDRIGITQEIGRNNEKNKRKNEINLKKFRILGLLGIGGFGTVYKVKHILSDKIYAMKVMNKNYIIKKKYLHYVVSEFEIMKSLAGFPFILELHYCFQTANYLYLIIDYCPNGDFTKLKKINNLKLFFAEVVLAFEHIHNHNIIYRDLKPENILLDETGHIRVCDFNLAKAGMTKGKRAFSFCGSPMYFSPELLLEKGLDYKCDIYGIGLLIYELVTGMPAFTASNIKSLYELIKNNQINFRVSGLHGDILDLLEKILVKEPEKRITLEEIKSHPYFKDIDFDKVLKKEYGKIETEKISKKNGIGNNNFEGEKPENKEEKEKLEYEKFKLLQQKMDDNKEYTFLKGKITVKEMFLDQKRAMKNFVRDFYYVKKEDKDQVGDFKLEIKEPIDISDLIMDNYEFEV